MKKIADIQGVTSEQRPTSLWLDEETNELQILTLVNTLSYGCIDDLKSLLSWVFHEGIEKYLNISFAVKFGEDNTGKIFVIDVNLKDEGNAPQFDRGG